MRRTLLDLVAALGALGRVWLAPLELDDRCEDLPAAPRRRILARS